MYESSDIGIFYFG